jgi:ribulose-phosphate 3-epimerase
MYEIIPGILEQGWVEIEKKINLVKSFAKTIHIDIIDGKFAQSSTFIDPEPFKKYSKDIFFELHMMVIDPTKYLKPFARAGFKRFIGHIEGMENQEYQEEFVAQGQLLGEVGLAVDGPTPISSIKVPYEDLDMITIMAIKAGKSGQVFNSEYLAKAEILKQVQDDPSAGSGLTIEVDGGINDKTIVDAKNAGANRFIANSFLFGGNPPAGGPQTRFDLLKSCLE